MTTPTPAAVEFAQGLTAAFGKSTTFEHTYSVEPGVRYDKIVQTWSGQRSVHAFVERATGHVLKADGWKRPAKGVRFPTVAAALAAATASTSGWAGGYLYAR